MRRLSVLAVARPRAILATYLVAVGALAIVGLGVEDELHRSDLSIGGTASAAALERSEAEFGNSEPLVILLEGPQAKLEGQGRALTRTIDRMPETSVLAPWRGVEELRPSRTEAVLLVRVDRPFEEVSKEVVPELRALVGSTITPPVESHLTGFADIAAGIHGGTVEAISDAEVIAAPLLLIVLLLVFRTPLAAGITLVLGLMTIGAGRGVVDLINRSIELDASALNLLSMMGLALGVDYALLVVSRFRQETAAGRSVEQAVIVAGATAGRTIVFAGLALAAAMTTSLLVAPGSILTSAAAGVLVAVVLSVLMAATALPAVLTLAGGQIERFPLGSGRNNRSAAFAARAIRRPGIAAGLVLLLLAVMAAPALGLELGAPDPRALPSASPERQDFERVRDVLGPGWAAPYEVVVTSNDRPVTDRHRLREIADWQRRMQKMGAIETVFGPEEIERRTAALRDAPEQLERAGDQLAKGRRGLARLDDGVELVAGGIAGLREGLGEGAEGAERLAGGARRADDGVSRLAEGDERASEGADRLGTGFGRLEQGTTRLTSGAERLHAGLALAARRLGEAEAPSQRLARGLRAGSRGLDRLREPADLAASELDEGLAALEAMLPTSKADPAYARTVRAVGRARAAVTGRDPRSGDRVEPGYSGLSNELRRAAGRVDGAAGGAQELADGIAESSRGLVRLRDGAARLDDGAARLADGQDRLHDGQRRLRAGLDRLAEGTSGLEAGAAALAGGAGELSSSLADGNRRSGELASGAARVEDGSGELRDRSADLTGELGGSTDDLARTLRSGYAPLAAIDSAPERQREAASGAVNVDRGGSAARMTMIPASDPRRDQALRQGLERDVERLGRDSGGEASLGGPAAILQDFGNETSSRLPLLVIALSIVTYLVLMPIFRSLLLPLLAVVLNLGTVAAAFGVLVLVFQGDASAGELPYLDSIVVLAIFSVVFGLSIDYEVFLIARMREGYALTGTTDGAIAYGLENTARVVTGAAMIMTGVFVAFAMADIATTKQLGVGLTVAVLLDATLVRLVLLPAAIRLVGDRTWWLPGWLDRLLPTVDTEGGHGIVAAPRAVES